VRFRRSCRNVGLVVASLLLIAVQPVAADSQRQAQAAATRFQTTRTFKLDAGRASRTFTFRERSGVIVLNRLTVLHEVRAFVDARIPHLAGARVSSWRAQKLRALELRAGMPSRRGQRGSTHAYNLKEVRARERALSEHGERGYRQLVSDWQAKARKRAGAGAATGVRL
jgi:hypothetical protein